ncbi:hypothetical protein CK203_115147 [Vitis vinifera]|uniref:Uncharacterized protein n=1 Tax=Vitis vinifera TaxID=29760 RepID=A0A438CAI6_VITVI|nr:hypothetical protein CK203_115147 [Vitis vinifera]
MVITSPIEAIQIIEPGHFIPSSISTLRPCSSSRSFGIHLNCFKVHDYSAHPESYAIHFSIDGCQGILEARHIAEALHIDFEPEDPAHFRECVAASQHFSSSAPTAETMSHPGRLLRISEGFYLGPHHLIMAGLLHFEEKVHRKQLQRADTIPLLFMRLICYILEHMGYPTEPHLERRHHCREYFTHDKWTQLAVIQHL